MEKYTRSQLKKLKKDDLISHITTLQDVIMYDVSNTEELFWAVSKPLKEYIDDFGTHKEGEVVDAIEKLKEQNQELKKENEELKKERDDFAIAMIKHTQENYDTWRKEQESVAIGLMKLDLDRSQKEIEELKKENEELKKEMGAYEHVLHKQGAELNRYLDGDYKIMKDNEKLKKENKKLKKENEKMKISPP